MGEEKFAALESIAPRLSEIKNGPIREAVKLGVFSKELGERMEKTEGTYWTFVVLDYFNGKVPAGMRRQIGTVKGIMNPAVASVLKALVLNRVNEFQRLKLALLEHIDEDFGHEVGPERPIDRYHREPVPPAGRGNLIYHVDG